MGGQRGANKAMFDSDLIICLGTYLFLTQPHYMKIFVIPKIIVNIDKNQLKNLNVKFNLKVCSVSYFLVYY